MLCEQHGVAYQTDMRCARVRYDDAYMAKVEAYEGSDIARQVNLGRIAMLLRHLPFGASVLDVGAGTGEFVRDARLAGFCASGDDVMPAAVARLRADGLHGDTPSMYDAVTMWDSIEHMESPENVLREIVAGRMLFVSTPIFDTLHLIRTSKHYRPGEHLYYWTAHGFVGWMRLHGFRCMEISAHEIHAGRESIGAFAFRKDLQ